MLWLDQKEATDDEKLVCGDLRNCAKQKKKSKKWEIHANSKLRKNKKRKKKKMRIKKSTEWISIDDDKLVCGKLRKCAKQEEKSRKWVDAAWKVNEKWEKEKNIKMKKSKYCNKGWKFCLWKGEKVQTRKKKEGNENNAHTKVRKKWEKDERKRNRKWKEYYIMKWLKYMNDVKTGRKPRKRMNNLHSVVEKKKMKKMIKKEVLKEIKLRRKWANE